MPYCTILSLHPNQDTLSLMDHPGYLHRYVSEMFPGKTRFIPDSNDAEIHVYTTDYPIINHIPDNLVDITPQEVSIHKGEYNFSIIANPVKTKDRKRVGITDDIELRNWFHRRFQNCATVKSLIIDKKGAKQFDRIKVYNGFPIEERITLNQVHFTGTISVIDPEEFETLVWHGVGSGKAFGYGIMAFNPIDSERNGE